MSPVDDDQDMTPGEKVFLELQQAKRALHDLASDYARLQIHAEEGWQMFREQLTLTRKLDDLRMREIGQLNRALRDTEKAN
jgi:hypothetical protein